MLRPRTTPLALSIVLPCHDEEANVVAVARRAVEVGRSVASDLEVLVVDDGSRDATFALADALRAELPELRIVQNAQNLGYGGALRTGFLAATRPWVFYTDGDGQFDIGELPRVLPLLESHDIVAGYRLHRSDPAPRRWNGRAWTAITNLALGLSMCDVNCAFKIFPRALFGQIALQSTGALIDAEILCKARRLGLTVAQVGVSHRPREAGVQTGGQPRVIGRALLELAELMVEAGPEASHDDWLAEPAE